MDEARELARLKAAIRDVGPGSPEKSICDMLRKAKTLRLSGLENIAGRLLKADRETAARSVAVVIATAEHPVVVNIDGAGRAQLRAGARSD